MDLVSVIIPTYNRRNFLKIAIDSVLKQTYKNFELIIIDDGSTDNTEELVKSYKESRIKYFYQFNRGPAVARNKGIKISKGNYIAFLDSDDRWREDKLKIQLEAMKKYPDYLISHTEEIWYRNGKILNPKKKHKKQHGNIYKQSLELCAISMSTVMVKREIFDKIGLFDEKLEVCEDYDYWLRVTSQYPVLLIDIPLTLKEGGHYDQLSHKYFGMDKYRIYSIEKLINSNELDKDKLKLAIKELEKKSLIYGKGCIKHNKKNEGEYYLELPEKYRRLL